MYTAFENNKYCSAILLDIKQASDRLWHTNLTHFIENTSAQRSLQVKTFDAILTTRDIKSGVPTVLSPDLYNLYSTYIPNSNSHPAKS